MEIKTENKFPLSPKNYQKNFIIKNYFININNNLNGTKPKFEKNKRFTFLKKISRVNQENKQSDNKTIFDLKKIFDKQIGKSKSNKIHLTNKIDLNCLSYSNEKTKTFNSNIIKHGLHNDLLKKIMSYQNTKNNNYLLSPKNKNNEKIIVNTSSISKCSVKYDNSNISIYKLKDDYSDEDLITSFTLRSKNENIQLSPKQFSSTAQNFYRKINEDKFVSKTLGNKANNTRIKTANKKIEKKYIFPFSAFNTSSNYISKDIFHGFTNCSSRNFPKFHGKKNELFYPSVIIEKNKGKEFSFLSKKDLTMIVNLSKYKGEQSDKNKLKMNIKQKNILTNIKNHNYINYFKKQINSK